MHLAPGLRIDDSDLQFSYFLASGPGGQHKNKVATAVRLQVDAAHIKILTERQLGRLLRTAGKRNIRGTIIAIEAKRFRSQEKNRSDAIERLKRMVTAAIQEKKRRIPSSPSRGSIEKRIQQKKKRKSTKEMRRTPRTDAY